MSRAETNGYKWVRKKVTTMVDKLLMRLTMKAFGWKLLKKSEVPYYGVSDEGIKQTFWKKYYYFVRPYEYSKNPLFHLTYGLAGFSRFLRKLSFYFLVVFWVLAFLGTALLGAWTEFVEIASFVQFTQIVAVASVFAYFAAIFANLVLLVLGFFLRPSEGKALSQSGEERARRSIDRNEQLDFENAERENYYAAQQASRVRQAYEERKAWEEEQEYNRLINEYNLRVDQMNEAERMANKALHDPYLTDEARIRLMDDATALSKRAIDEANYFSEEIRKREE